MEEIFLFILYVYNQACDITIKIIEMKIIFRCYNSLAETSNTISSALRKIKLQGKIKL